MVKRARFTPEQFAKLEEMFLAHKPVPVIADRIGKSQSAVYGHVRRLREQMVAAGTSQLKLFRARYEMERTVEVEQRLTPSDILKLLDELNIDSMELLSIKPVE